MVFLHASAGFLSPAMASQTGLKTLSAQAEFKQTLNKAQALVEERKLPEARELYQKLYRKNLRAADMTKVKAAIQDLNVRILFAGIEPDEYYSYEVQKGNALYPLARRLGVSAELIQRQNRLKSNAIRPGTSLKISNATFSIHVSKSRNTLDLYKNGKWFKTYPVATGRDNSTPVGKFFIKNKSVNPDWYKDGKKIPAGSPDNILGTRWMGFDLPQYGIHGTTLPETIGQQASDGCVRMLNRDVEELYAIVPEKTVVTVVD